MKFVQINGIAVNAMHIVSIYPVTTDATNCYYFDVELNGKAMLTVGCLRDRESVNEMRKSLLMSF